MLRQAKIIVRLIGVSYVITIILIVAIAMFSSSLYVSTGYSIAKTVMDIIDGPIKLPKIVNKNALSIYTSRIPMMVLTPLYNISSDAGFFASITIASANNDLFIVLGLDKKGYRALGLSNYMGKIILGNELARRLGIKKPGNLLLNGVLARSHVLVRIDSVLSLPGRLNEILITPLNLSQMLQQRPYSIVSAFYILDSKVLGYINRLYKIYIYIPEKGVLQVYSIDGKLLYNKMVTKHVELQLPVGYYIVVYSTNRNNVISNTVQLFKDTRLEIHLFNTSKWARVFFLGKQAQVNITHKLLYEKELNYIVFYVTQGENTIILNNNTYRNITIKADTIVSSETVKSLTPRTCIQLKYWNGTLYNGLIEIDYRGNAYIINVNKGLICSYISNYKLRLLSVSGEITYLFSKPSNKTIIIPPHKLLAKVPVDLLLKYLSDKTVIENIIGIMGSGMAIIFAILIIYSILIIPLPYIIFDNMFNEIFSKMKKLEYLGASRKRINELISKILLLIIILSIIVSIVLSILVISLIKINPLLLVYRLDINNIIIIITNIGVGIIYLAIMYKGFYKHRVEII